MNSLKSTGGAVRLLAQAESNRSDRPTAYEWISGILLPAGLALVATRQPDSTQFWAIFLFAVVVAAPLFYKRIRTSFKGAVLRSRDRRFVRNKRYQLVQLVSRFGEFVDPAKHNTFHELVRREVCRSNTNRLDQLCIAPENLFSDFWSALNVRSSNSGSSVTSFLQTVDEFLALVNNYVRYCLEPVFERMPEGIRSELRPEARAELEEYLERFLTYREKIEDFTREVAQEVGHSRRGGYYVARLKPLHGAAVPPPGP